MNIDWSAEYDKAVDRLANTLVALAVNVRDQEKRRSGGRHPDGTPIDRVWVASQIRREVMLRLFAEIGAPLDSLMVAAIKAEHPTARDTPAVLLDKAAAALLPVTEAAGDESDPEVLAEAALRGAGVIR